MMQKKNIVLMTDSGILFLYSWKRKLIIYKIPRVFFSAIMLWKKMLLPTVSYMINLTLHLCVLLYI